MKMLPEVIFETPSKAEEYVFELLRSSNIFPGAAALHSLNCSEHDYKQWAEIDFCVVSPDGIFVLEVKGGGVSIQDGVWHYRGSKGEGTSNEGPFQQAKTARFALEEMLEKRYRVRSELSNKPVFGFGVIFVDTPWDKHSPEMPREIVADRDECRDQSSFDEYLTRLASYWRNKQKNTAALSKADISTIRQKMRPDIDFFPPFTMRMGQALGQLQKMTEDQYQFLEWIEPNNQIIVTGGAGTGKTFLAMQCARMETKRGRRCAIVVESPTLAAHIRLMEPSKEISILTLPQARRLSGREKFDVILVDEGQDLLSIDNFSLLSNLVEGGLEEGRWRWFMDVNKQAHLRGSFEEEALEVLQKGFGSSDPFLTPLSTNVRNTKEIIGKVERWTAAEIGKTKYTGHGSAPRLIAAESVDDVVSAVEALMDEFQQKEIPAEDIGIIVAERMGDEAISKLEKALRNKALRLGPSTVSASLKGKAVIGSAADFKGLERPIVFAIGFDLDEASETGLNELYVATTRGNYGLVVVGTERLTDHLKSK